ncbi:hypothetical protein GPX89_36895 [Nocardia sp. ET3-3]|uniref:Photosynthesis system II assembly factor Ycf48/Hcf136-like domain-containing protein n=1 Tax=Nocardia terrae TaxID=2675851 RepID=A0A7K1V815_9NOCA|nr:hypothetical protein [Nocardia terrae]MVU82800.1 hypothetical protein [Nocardia terrae]
MRRRLIAVIGMAVVGMVLTGIVLVRGGSVRHSPGDASGLPSTPAAAAAAGPCFEPDYVKFSSPEEGWAVGRADCGYNLPIRIKCTHDGGRTWRNLPAAPSEFVTYGMTLVDARTAFTHSGDTLWATHDGGMTWSEQTIPGVGPQSSMAVAAGRIQVADLRSDGLHILSSDVDRQSDWTDVRVDLDLSGLTAEDRRELHGYPAIDLSGPYGWLMVYGKNSVVATARLVDGTWVSTAQPCGAAGPLEASLSPANRLLLVECGGPGPYHVGQRLPQAMTSADGGATFVASNAGWPRDRDFYPSLTATPGLLAATDKNQLLITADGGAQWTTAYTGPPSAEFEGVEFVSATEGFVLMDPDPNGPPHARQILVTRDGGRGWSPLVFTS